MPRPSVRRSGAVVAIMSLALLGACTGNSPDETNVGPTPAVAETAATSTANSVMGAAIGALANTGGSGDEARAAAFSGSALTAANAWTKALSARTDAQREDAAISPTGSKVLGVSRAGVTPKALLVQASLLKSGAPILVLMQTEAGADDFKVAAMAPVLPDATVDALDGLDVGSGPIGDGANLAAQPDALITAWAGSVAFPDPTKTDLLEADPFTDQLRKNAASQAKALGADGVYTQEHTAGEVIGGLRLADGVGAIVFADLQRTDQIALRNAKKLTPSRDFTLLTGVKTITSEASLDFVESVAFIIPAEGTSRIVAATDQLVDGSGR